MVELDWSVEEFDVFRQGHGLPVIDPGVRPAVRIEDLLRSALAVGAFCLIFRGWWWSVRSIVDTVFGKIVIAVDRPGPDSPQL